MRTTAPDGDRKLRVGILFAAALLGVTGALQGSATVKVPTGSDQFAFFMPAAERIAQGDPGGAYRVSFQGFPVDMPPLSLLLEAVQLRLGETVLPAVRGCAAGGFVVPSCTTSLWWINLWSVPLVLLLGLLVERVVGGRRGVIALALIGASPLLWMNTTIWGHLEEPLMALLLVAGVWLLQRDRPWSAAVTLGLAAMTRSTAAAPMLALLVLLLIARDFRRAAKLVVGAAAVAFAVLAPFLLTDARDTVRALLLFHGSAPVRNSVWCLLRGTPLASLAQHLDVVAMLLATLAVATWAGLRRGVTVHDDDVWAVVALASLMVPLFAKTLWPYYFVEPVAALLIWELRTGRRRAGEWWRWPTISLAYLCVTGTLQEFIGPEALNGLTLRLAGVTNFAFLAIIVCLVLRRAQDLQAGASAIDRDARGADRLSGTKPSRGTWLPGGTEAPQTGSRRHARDQAPRPGTLPGSKVPGADR